MTVTPALGIALMLNNYVHDVATGLLLLSALWLGWTARDLGPAPEPAALALFRAGYRRSLRFVATSIVVIVATGVVRTLFFMDFEWTIALGKGLVPILLLKHALIFSMLGAGIWAWVGLRRRLATIPGWNDEGR